AVRRGGPVRRGAAALRIRSRLDLAFRIDHVRPRHHVHAGGGLDLARERPRAGRCALRRRRGAHRRLGRSDRRSSSAAALHAGARLVLAALCRALLDDPGALTRDKRHSGGVPAQDADSAVRADDGAARRRAGDPRRRCSRRTRALSMPLAEVLAVLLVVAVCGLLFLGYPVALTLGGVSLAFAALGHLLGVMQFGFLAALPQRVYGVMTNDVLLAIPLFVFM